MYNMFAGCKSKFNSENLDDMNELFYGYHSLNSIGRI